MTEHMIESPMLFVTSNLFYTEEVKITNLATNKGRRCIQLYKTMAHIPTFFKILALRTFLGES